MIRALIAIVRALIAIIRALIAIIRALIAMIRAPLAAPTCRQRVPLYMPQRLSSNEQRMRILCLAAATRPTHIARAHAHARAGTHHSAHVSAPVRATHSPLEQ
jgi:hypothetical protein